MPVAAEAFGFDVWSFRRCYPGEKASIRAGSRAGFVASTVVTWASCSSVGNFEPR